MDENLDHPTEPLPLDDLDEPAAPQETADEEEIELPEHVGLREVLTELVKQRAKPKPPAKPKTLVALCWDPQILPPGPDRVQAWWRLSAFVDWLNALFGAQRTPMGYGPRWIQGGWWLNPLAVTHLAALERAWAACLISDDPFAMSDSSVEVLLKDTQEILELVCGKHSEANLWGQVHKHAVNFSLDVPTGEPSRDEVKAVFAEFVANEQPVPHRTDFIAGLLAELNPSE